MEFYRLWEDNPVFVAVLKEQDTMWICDKFTLKNCKISDNKDIADMVFEHGVPIKEMIFDMSLPKKLNAQGHFNLSLYMTSCENKNKTI